MLSMGQGQDWTLSVRLSPVITWQGLSEATCPRASQEAEAVGAGQDLEGTRSGAGVGGQQ